jgi:ABC-type Mn2+/Zn2+ transport system ATPase subunit
MPRPPSTCSMSRRARWIAAKGDIHPRGNPHYWLPPVNALKVAKEIAARLKELDPSHGADYDANLQNFGGLLKSKSADWSRKAASLRGLKVVPYHKSWTYVSDWLGLREMGYVELKPGIQPDPKHLAELILRMKAESVRVLMIESFYNRGIAGQVADAAGAKLLVLPSDVGATAKIRSYPDLVDAVLDALVAGAKSDGKELAAVDLIQLRAAEIGYKKPILPAIDLTVRAGERIAILGPNGAGKSTLLRTIIGTLPVLAGRMDYPLGRRPTMGYVPQSHQPDAAFPLTTHEVVLMGRYPALGVARRPRKADHEAASHELELVGLAKQESLLFRQLSGGQRQRAARGARPGGPARAAGARRADQRARSGGRAWLAFTGRQTGRGHKTCVLFVTHQISAAAGFATDVVLINHLAGVVEHGRVAELLTSEKLSRLYGLPIEVARENQRTLVWMASGERTRSDHERHQFLRGLLPVAQRHGRGHHRGRSVRLPGRVHRAAPDGLRLGGAVASVGARRGAVLLHRQLPRRGSPRRARALVHLAAVLGPGVVVRGFHVAGRAGAGPANPLRDPGGAGLSGGLGQRGVGAGQPAHRARGARGGRAALRQRGGRAFAEPRSAWPAQRSWWRWFTASCSRISCSSRSTAKPRAAWAIPWLG